MTHTHTGWMIGHFEPLHQGHVRIIQHAIGLVEQLHIVILEHPDPNPDYPVTLADKVRWMQRAFNYFPFIHIHSHPTANINPEKEDAQLILQTIRSACGISDKARLISDESHAWSYHLPAERLIALPLHNEYDSNAIHRDPVRYWPLIHPTARRDYTRTIAVVGGESSGKTTLVHKLANYFLADYVLEQGRLYVDYDLGGSELALQFSDYQRIAIDHAKAINQAMEAPKAPVMIVDTDFVTTQAFCLTYENRRDPVVDTFIDQIRFDHTLLLANNTVWVDDGLRSLGNEKAREAFQNTLHSIFREYAIPIHEIRERSYQARYEQAVQYIEKHIYGKSQTS